MKFKNVWIEQQFKQIVPDLRVVLSFLDLFVRKKYGKEIVVTSLIRTRQEQIKLYKDTPKYKDRPADDIPHSVHEYGRGGDVRLSNFTSEELKEIMQLLNSVPYGNGRYQTALMHDIGAGNHIHIQVRGY